MKQNTKQLYSLILAMLFLIVAFVVYFDMVVPAYSDLQTTKGNEIGEQNLLANENTIAGQINNLIQTYQSQSGDLAAVDAALPIGPDLADALAQLYGIAQANNVTIQSLGITQELSPTAQNGGSTVSGAASSGQIVNPIGSIAFAIGFSGSYENFKNFVVALEDNMRFFDISSISIVGSSGSTASGASSDFFNFSLVATAYYQSQ